jgi:AbiV family abortive infection protein
MSADEYPVFNAELLRTYSEAALMNSADLLAEAELLLAHEHHARAYFLAVAAIEEAGKALQAFDAQNRNLSDPAVRTRLRAGMEDHSHKLSYVLATWGMNSENPYGGLEKGINLAVHLKYGREPAMYSDLRVNPDRVQIPKEVVRQIAATDCVRLAQGCIEYARRHVKEKKPFDITGDHDRLLTMKPKKFRDLLNNADFWLFAVELFANGNRDFARAAIEYEEKFSNKGLRYRRADEEE